MHRSVVRCRYNAAESMQMCADRRGGRLGASPSGLREDVYNTVRTCSAWAARCRDTEGANDVQASMRMHCSSSIDWQTELHA